MVRRGSSVRVRHWALVKRPANASFLFAATPAPGPRKRGYGNVLETEARRSHRLRPADIAAVQPDPDPTGHRCGRLGPAACGSCAPRGEGVPGSSAALARSPNRPSCTRHPAALLATARRYSASPEDVEDAYQRGVELLLTKAPTTTEDELLPWVKTVVLGTIGPQSE